MRASRRALAFGLLLLGCGQSPAPATFVPLAKLPPPVTTAMPQPGPFNGEVAVPFTTDFPATVYVSVNGSDPRTTSKGRLEGPSPLKVKLSATTAVQYFSSLSGRDEELRHGTWTRAGGPVGTISGFVVVSAFAAGKLVGVSRNFETISLGKAPASGELPFLFTGAPEGANRLTATMDRDEDGNLIPFLDFQSAVETITLDFTDPYKASAENVRLYLGSSPPELCTIAGTITLPKPPTGQNLQISAIGASGFGAGLDPQALLAQLQSGYRIFTTPAQTAYPYVITDLKPGLYVPVPLLLGFGSGGVAMNFLANALRPVNCVAGATATSDHAFGPVSLSGAVDVSGTSAPGGPFTYGVIAAKNVNLLTGSQAVLMPVVFGRDPATMALNAAFGAAALRSNSSFGMRVFTSGSAGTTGNPISDALLWAINPFAPEPPQTTVNLTTADQTVVIHVP